MDFSRKIAEKLLAMEAVKLSPMKPFTWTSGLKSPIYCDNRMMISDSEAVKLVTDGFKELLMSHNVECDFFAGTATAGIPWASFFAYEMKKPMVYVRPKPKEHGAGKQIEGALPGGQCVVVIEDLISTGGSSAKTVDVLRSEGKAMVDTIFAIFSYQFEASKRIFSESSIKAYTLCDVSTLTEVAVEKKYISQTEREMVIAFTKAPDLWVS